MTTTDTRAIYPLSGYIANFEFVAWLLAVQSLGAESVVIDLTGMKTAKWTQKQIEERVDSIMVPACELAGIPVSLGNEGKTYGVKPNPESYMPVLRNGFKRPVSVLPPGREKYTVTLRKESRIPERNSNEKDWRRFAGEIGALVIEDYSVKPIHLHERVALYAGARMNFFVTNGPAFLCMLMGLPMMMFNGHLEPGIHKRFGMEEGGQFPFQTENQRYIYEADTYENMVKYFQW